MFHKNINFYLSSQIILKDSFHQKHIFYFSNIFYKIYYGLDDPKYTIPNKSNNNKKYIQKKIEYKIINTKGYNIPKIMNQYKYSLIPLKQPKTSTNNILKNVYNYIINNIRKKYNKSDTKILLSDISTSYNNLKYNFRFYLNPKTLSYISKIGNIQLFSSTSKALKILNNNDILNIDNKIKDIPQIENKLKYLYEQMLVNNFKNKNYLNKLFCNDSTLLLLETIYGKNKKYPIDVEFPSLVESEITGKELKCIRFKINIIEFSLKNGKIEENSYIVEVGKNPNLNYVKKNGHNLLIKNIQLAESNNIFI